MRASKKRSPQLLAALAPVVLALPTYAQSTLWVTDDVTKNVYEVTSAGSLISFFKNPPGGNSEVAFDESDDTLWIAAEGGVNTPGRIFNVNQEGDILSSFGAADYGGFTPEGVVVDRSDDTLWIADDNETIPILAIFHVDKAGGLLGSFPTSSYDPLSTSPQGIALDPATDTLWIADNSTSRIYHVTKAGTLLSSFSTMMFASGFINPQGISVNPDGSLWVTARNTSTLYNITQTGVLLSSFSSTVYDPLALNPTGIAVVPDDTPPFIDLGAAGSFAVLGLHKTKFKLKDSSSFIAGDVGLGRDGKQEFDKGFIDGTFFVDPSADNSRENDVVITGGTTTESLAQAEADALAASDAARDLPADQSFDKIKESTIVFGQPGLNVIEIKEIDLKKDRRLTLFGGADAAFVLNVEKKFKIKEGAELELTGGVLPEFVLIHLIEKELEISKDAVVRGTVLAREGKVKIKEGGRIVGRVIAGGKELEVSKGAEILP